LEAKQFDWASTQPVGAVLVFAGGVFRAYMYDPAEKSDTGLVASQGKGISHITFCGFIEKENKGEWCSPGYWRQPQHIDSWTATGISPDDKYSAYFGAAPSRNKQGVTNNAPTDPTLLEVLQFPQYYGGEAFNKVGDLLSEEHPDVDYKGQRVEDSCPLN
jgi:hypothetical protein